MDLVVGFSGTISLSQSDLKLHVTGSTCACPSPSTPSPIKQLQHCSVQVYVYNPKCHDPSESSTLLWISCRAVEYCLTLSLAFACSIRVLRILQNQMLLNLAFLPTGRFCLRHNLLHLLPSLS